MQASRTNEQIRIVIADDHAIFRQGLSTVISGNPIFNVTGQACNGKELIDVVDATKPDIVITDIQMPEMNGYHATSCITEKYPRTGVIALSIFENEYSILKMLQAGARGYLLKNSDQLEITKAILRVHRNENYISIPAFHNLTNVYRQPEKLHLASKVPEFTLKELAVIKLICQQYLTKEIATILNTSNRSIDSAKERIQNKIGIRNMVGIVIFALQTGLITLNECQRSVPDN